MIRRLRIERFGKFTSRDFEFGPCTLFVGGNESGKSTIFDAMFDAICKPKGSSSHGRILKLRYGDDRAARIDGELGGSFDPAEYVNLLAIRSADLGLDLSSTESWVNQVKNALFTGGIDPLRIKDALEKETSTKENTVSGRTWKRANDARALAATTLAARREDRRRVLNAEKSLNEETQALSRASDRIDKLKAAREETRRALEQQLAIRERRDFAAVLAADARLRELDRGSAEFSGPGGLLAPASWRHRLEEVDRVEAEAEAARNILARAQAEAGRIGGEATSGARGNSVTALVLGSVALAGGLTGLAVDMPLPLRVLLVVGGTVLGVILIVVGLRGNGRNAELTNRIKEAHAALQTAAEGSEAAQARLRTLLSAAGTATTSEFREKARRILTLATEKAAVESELAELRRRHGATDNVALRREALARVELLNERIIDPALPESDFAALRVRLAKLDKEVDAASEAAASLESTLAEGRGRVTGNLGRLPEEILRAECELAAADFEVRRLSIHRRAAAVAAGIFDRLEKDNAGALNDLAADVGATFGLLVSGNRGLRFGRLDIDSTQVEDAGGRLRDFPQLSKGTQAAFLLAARLVLAEKARPDAGFIVFDEAFESFDAGREAKAIELLSRFSARTGWQIVLFTTQERAVPLARKFFSGPVVHELRP